MTDKPRISHTQIQSYRGCQQAHDYRYNQHLVSKRLERPLHVGKWGHSLQEAFYKGDDWHVMHADYTAEYDKLFEEEKLRLDKGKSKAKSVDRDDYIPLPDQVERIFTSYLWYHRHDKEETLAVEVEFEMDRGFYTLYGVIDRVYRDLNDGLIWVQDHKWVDEIPDETMYQTMDPQLTYYLRAVQEVLGVKAAGVEYNYVCSKTPATPDLNKNGTISKSAITTDYPTLFRWLKANGFDPREYTDLLGPLARTSPLLQRYRLPRADVVTARILEDADRTAAAILGRPTPVRNISRGCNWCPFAAVCRGDLFGIDTSYMRANTFMTEAEREQARAKRG